MNQVTGLDRDERQDARIAELEAHVAALAVALRELEKLQASQAGHLHEELHALMKRVEDLE